MLCLCLYVSLWCSLMWPKWSHPCQHSPCSSAAVGKWEWERNREREEEREKQRKRKGGHGEDEISLISLGRYKWGTLLLALPACTYRVLLQSVLSAERGRDALFSVLYQTQLFEVAMCWKCSEDERCVHPTVRSGQNLPVCLMLLDSELC